MWVVVKGTSLQMRESCARGPGTPSSTRGRPRVDGPGPQSLLLRTIGEARSWAICHVGMGPLTSGVCLTGENPEKCHWGILCL